MEIFKMEDITLDDIYDCFYDLIYEDNSSLINFYDEQKDSIDKFCKEIENQHDGITDRFIDCVYEKVDFEIFTDDPQKKKYMIDSWDSLNDLIAGFHNSFDQHISDSEIVFNSKNEKFFFKWYVGYLADRLGAGHSLTL